LEATSLNENGLTVTHQAMVQAQEHLLRRGFKPDADGLSLDKFFNGNQVVRCIFILELI